MAQVASRLFLVWGIVFLFPGTARSAFYTSMLVAWSATELVRYSYFALALCGVQPRALTWLRYSTFIVLYPLGIVSECRLILLASGPAARVHPLAPLVLYAVLVIYVPGSYVLYTHMLRQRRKTLSKAVGDTARSDEDKAK